MRSRRHLSPLVRISLHFSVALACSSPAAPVGNGTPPLGTASPADPEATHPDARDPDARDPDGVPDAPISASIEPVRLRFAARVGAEPFACGSTYRTTSGESFTPADLRLFVQDVALIDADGVEHPVELDVRAPWQAEGVALVDFEDASAGCLAGTRELNLEVTGGVAPGAYRGIAFSNGVPEAFNHADPSRLPPPLQAGSMSWGWLQGYRFMMAEIAGTASVGDAAAPGSALLHVGSTACSGNPSAGGIACAKPNRNRVRLSEFDADADAIVIDVAELFGDMDLATVTTCHSSGDDCGPLFERVGIDLASGSPSDAQRIYRVEPASATDP
ncbi:MAG TPA: MbnP family copper-binding protein [Polyangiaceae bacterium]|nr:MbnP family copper-binding protein [Polyangiaceae bacterium]